jgi:RNA polymerase sigma-70 factor (ECF subfamily)
MNHFSRLSVDQRSDSDLLSAAAGGEHRAFKTLMERHAAAAQALAKRIVGGASDADDIAQEAFLRAWKAAPGWRANGKARFATWLYRVVTNLCMDRLRQPPARPLDLAAGVEARQSDGYDQTLAAANRVRVRKAMAALTPGQRAAIALYHFSEMRGAEAAQVLGVSVPAFESLLVRGRRSLRSELYRQGIQRLEDIL